MLISIIIPVYNEINTISKILDAVHSSPIWNHHQKEIIVVDDFSNDGTRELLIELDNQINKVIFHEKNSGKGAALRSGFKSFSGDILIIQDADLEYDPAEYPILVKPIEDNRADVVYGSRFVGGGSHRVVYFWHMIGNRFLTFV